MKNITLITIVLAGSLLSGCSFPVSEQTNNSNLENPDKKEQQNNEEPYKTPQTDKILNLSNQNLQEIPNYVFDKKDTEELNVSNNNLTGAIQAEIRHLQNLKVLNAANNQMTGVPAEIGQLRNLQILDLSNNQLTGLPYELGNLENLKTLNISGNDYSELDLSIIKEKLPQDVNIIK